MSDLTIPSWRVLVPILVWTLVAMFLVSFVFDAATNNASTGSPVYGPEPNGYQLCRAWHIKLGTDPELASTQCNGYGQIGDSFEP